MKLSRPEKVRILFEKIAAANPGHLSVDDEPLPVLEKKTVLKGGTVTTARFDLGVIKEWMELEEGLLSDHESGPFKAEAIATPAGSQTIIVSQETVVPPSPSVPFSAPEVIRVNHSSDKGLFWIAGGFLAMTVVVLLAASYFPKISSIPETSKTRAGIGAEGNSNFKAILEKRDATILHLNGLLNQLNRQIGSLREQLKNAAYRIADLDRMGTLYREELLGIDLKHQEELEALRQGIRGRDFQVQSLRSELQQTKALFAKQQAVMMQGQQLDRSSRPVLGSWTSSFSHTLRGKVALVNGPYRFVIVDVGMRRGARVGQAARFYQPDGQELGTGRIEKVYPTFATATVFSALTLSRIQEGDTVFLGGLTDLQSAAG